jgi:excinuclease UvrABC helicase subunit UvrB
MSKTKTTKKVKVPPTPVNPRVEKPLNKSQAELLKTEMTELSGKIKTIHDELEGLVRIIAQNRLEKFAIELGIDLVQENWIFDWSKNVFMKDEKTSVTN